MNDYTNFIIGISFFAISEILPILPIPANGILHSIFIGLKNSFNPDIVSDTNTINSLISTKPEIGKFISNVKNNPKLFETISMLNRNPEISKYIKHLSNDRTLKFINELLINNPESIDSTKNLIINLISNAQQVNAQQVNAQQVDTQQVNTQQVNTQDNNQTSEEINVVIE